jgi:hypothetical protein
VSKEDPEEAADRWNDFHLHKGGESRRSLNEEEVHLLVIAWSSFPRGTREPLHSWLGWTTAELRHWKATGELPE